jgi:hypothetical protein
MEFYVTFGQDHPLRHHYVIARGATYDRARRAVFQILGPKWAFMYDSRPWDPELLGAVGEPIEAENILDEEAEPEDTQHTIDCDALAATGFSSEHIATVLRDPKSD